MTDNWALTAAVLGLVVGFSALVLMVWYEKKQASKWSEYGRKIDGWTDEDWRKP